MDISTQLREASHDLHRAAERTGLMQALLNDRLSRRDYAIWMQNLQAIYSALECGLEHGPILGAFDLVQIYRSPAIAKDLAWLQPTSDQVLCEATLQYVERLKALTTSDPLLLLAHAYVRYLGDLHGGQLLRRRVARVLQSDGADGLAFYDFGNADRVARFIAGFRTGLNGLNLDTTQSIALAQEARHGFAMHIDMFQQLPHSSGIGFEGAKSAI